MVSREMGYFFSFFFFKFGEIKLCRCSGLDGKAKTFKFRSLNFTWHKTEGVKQLSYVVLLKRKTVLAS